MKQSIKDGMYLAMHKNDPQFLNTDINPTKQTEVALEGIHQP